jgi:hypothetical protein
MSEGDMADCIYPIHIPKLLGNCSLLKMCLFVKVRSDVNGCHPVKPFIMLE